MFPRPTDRLTVSFFTKTLFMDVGPPRQSAKEIKRAKPSINEFIEDPAIKATVCNLLSVSINRKMNFYPC